MASAHVPADGPPLRRCRPLENPAPHFRRIFLPAFLEALPVVPASGRLPGLPFLHGFFHGNFSRKNAGKNRPCSGGHSRRCYRSCLARRFAGGPPSGIRSRSGAARSLDAPKIGPAPLKNFQRFFRRGILCARSKSCFLVYQPPIVLHGW